MSALYMIAIVLSHVLYQICPEAHLGLLQHPRWKQLTIITKRSALDVTADLDPPLMPSVHIGMIFALDRG